MPAPLAPSPASRRCRSAARAWRRGACGLALLALLGAPRPVAAAIRFTDVTAEAGLGYLQQVLRVQPDCLLPPDGEIAGLFCEPERMTGGAAVGDVDGDGWTDLLVTSLEHGPLLFRNLGDGSFADVTGASGLALPVHANGAAFGDIDNDGDLDLYLTRTYLRNAARGCRCSRGGGSRGSSRRAVPSA